MVSSNGPQGGGNDVLFRYKDGDQDAYSAIYNQYSPEIYRFLYYHIGNKEDAEDLTTDTFIRLYTNRDGIEFRYRVKPFLFAVARNLALNLHKWRKVRITHAKRLALLKEETYMDLQFLTSDLINYLLRQQVLTPAQLEVIKLHLRGLSTKEIAERLGATEQNIRNLKARAIDKWQEHVKGRDLLIILLLLSNISIDNQYFNNSFSIGVQEISKKDFN